MAAVDDLIQGNNVIVSVEDVKEKMLRDTPRLNELTRQELTDEEYADTIIKVIAEWNALPPYFDNQSHLQFWDRALLLDWASSEALLRLARWHARNSFSANDAGMQVPVHEQWQNLLAIGKDMRDECVGRAKLLKTQLNISRGWGGVSSPLWWK